MRPHPRIRKTVKWGGAVVTATLAFIWIASGWYQATFAVGPLWEVVVQHGRASVSEPTPVLLGYKFPRLTRSYGAWNVNATATGYGPAPFRLDWWFDQVHWTSTIWGPGVHSKWYIPLWSMVAPAGGVTTLAWRLDTLARRRARLGVCPKCSYSRAGLPPSAPCPECGAPASNETPAPR